MNVDAMLWNQFVEQYGPRTGRFLQSWQWGEFQEKQGYHIDRLVLDSDLEIGALALCVKNPIPFFGSYTYVPGGAIGKTTQQVKEVLEQTLQSNLFTRFETYGLDDLPARSVKTIDLQPAQTLITDLSSSEETLLSNMHHKTRYNVNLALRKGVHIRFDSFSFDQVWSLFEETSVRGVFRLHEKKHYQLLLDTLNEKECCAFLAVATYEDIPIAVNIMIDFQGTRTYLHGGSSREYGKFMAPYLLHWELMRDAKAHGMKWYDWWGVSPFGAESHPWEGISRFKRGFGGEEVVSLGTYDLVGKPLLYEMYKILRGICRA